MTKTFLSTVALAALALSSPALAKPEGPQTPRPPVVKPEGPKPSEPGRSSGGPIFNGGNGGAGGQGGAGGAGGAGGNGYGGAGGIGIGGATNATGGAATATGGSATASSAGGAGGSATSSNSFSYSHREGDRPASSAASIVGYSSSDCGAQEGGSVQTKLFGLSIGTGKAERTCRLTTSSDRMRAAASAAKDYKQAWAYQVAADSLIAAIDDEHAYYLKGAGVTIVESPKEVRRKNRK